ESGLVHWLGDGIALDPVAADDAQASFRVAARSSVAAERRASREPLRQEFPFRHQLLDLRVQLRDLDIAFRFNCLRHRR
ncbi:hypothetical protein, partial [Pseudomonas sp. FW305-33]|uniref:hypothetical protein n=1 Tax=Pseudomonas sp. FW305-33 TaxID=2751337 RepID=UPI001C43A961